MPLFPALGPQYYEEKHQEILARMEAFYAESITINQSFWQEADTDTRFEAGDQTLWNEYYGNLPVTRRRQFNFNRIRRTVEMPVGFQRKNRKSFITIPVENADTQTADQFTKILLWISNQEGVLETISDSFHGGLVTGMNLLQVWMDYRSDPISGNIKVDNCSYNSFIIDPYFRKHDLSDCNAIWKRSYLTKRECIAIMPGKTEEIMSLWGHDNRDGKFQFMPEGYSYGMKNLLTYDEYYYRDYRTQQMMVDTQTGESMEWKHQDKDKLKQFLRAFPQVTMVESEIPTVRLAIVIQGKVMYDGPNPLGIDAYPFVPVFAYFNPQMPYFPWRIQGMVRGLRDAQYLYNRRKIIELDILESQINSGWVYKENSLVNPADVFLSGQGRGLALKDEAQMTDVQQIIAPQIPPSMIELSKILAQEITEISGVNEELLGSATDDKAGILSMLRQGAGLTTLQTLFDNLDRSQKLLGKLLIDLIQANFTPGKVKKILEGEEPAPQFYNKAFGKYHCAVEDGLNTTTQRQMQFAQMLQLRESQVPITDQDLLEASTLQGKNKIVENMQQQKQQAMQMQQSQMQMAAEAQQASIEKDRAVAVANQSLGLERISRVDENKALAEERHAQALKDEDMALLNKVRALKEIDELDISSIERLVNLTNQLKAQDEGLHQATKQSNEAPVPTQSS